MQCADADTKKSWLVRLALTLLLLLYFILAVTAQRNKSATFDEPAHLFSGLAILQEHDYRLLPDNGILAQQWAALPLWFVAPPVRDSYYWNEADGWSLAQEFFLTGKVPVQRTLFLSRAMISLLGVALGLVIYLWSSRLFGVRGGLISLTLYVLNPPMLAAGGLITCDLLASLAFLLAVGAAWRLFTRITPLNTLLASLAAAALLLSKNSGVLLLPMLFCMVLVKLIQPDVMHCVIGKHQYPFQRRITRAGVLALLCFVCALLVVGFIWLAYGFHFPMLGNAPLLRTFRIKHLNEVLPHIGAKGPIFQFLQSHQLLPEGYILGNAITMIFANERWTFLDEQWSLIGWTRFFPLCFLYKTPISMMVMLIVAASAFILSLKNKAVGSTRFRQLHEAFFSTTPLWILMGVYLAVILTSRLNIGHRHMLPIYPPLFILAGAAAGWLRCRFVWIKPMLCSLLLLGAVELSLVFPHNLAFFNLIAGGPSQGYRHLVDSSLDWGQDLPGLKRWLDQHMIDQPGQSPRLPCYVTYFGGLSHDLYQIKPDYFLPGYLLKVVWRQPLTLKPGYYCIGATILQGTYNKVPGPWTRESESAYQSLRTTIEAWRAAAPDSPQRLEIQQQTKHPWPDTVNLFGEYQFARLLHYLRSRQPDEEIGYSILIYSLSQQELDAAVLGPLDGLRSQRQLVRGCER